MKMDVHAVLHRKLSAGDRFDLIGRARVLLPTDGRRHHALENKESRSS
jgi:hypothetical protein